MREPPSDFMNQLVLRLMQESWLDDVDTLEELPPRSVGSHGVPVYHTTAIKVLNKYLPDEKLNQNSDSSIKRLSYFPERQRLAGLLKQGLDKEAAEKGLPPTPELLHPVPTVSLSKIPSPGPPSNSITPTPSSHQENTFPSPFVWIIISIIAIVILTVVWIKIFKKQKL